MREDDETGVETTELAAAHTLRIRQGANGDVVEIISGEGNVAVTLRVSQDGVSIDLQTASLALRTTGDLTLDAGRLNLRGRDGIDITTDGALALTAQEQSLRATLGNVDVRANDDVTLDGERVLLNCPEGTTPPPPRLRRRDK